MPDTLSKIINTNVDTLAIKVSKQINQSINLYNDSLLFRLNSLNNQIRELNLKVDKLTEKSTFSLWSSVVIAALITAVIGTLLSQWIDRMVRHKRENEKDMRESQSKCVNTKILLKDLGSYIALSPKITG